MHAVRWDKQVRETINNTNPQLVTQDDLKYHKVEKESWRDFNRFLKFKDHDTKKLW